MKKNEERDSVQEAKAKIRERYQGVDQNLLEIIPEEKKGDIFHPEKTLNVAIYTRTKIFNAKYSTVFDLQKDYYINLISRRPEWNLIEIYTDEWALGTSFKQRDSFLRMIEDCKAGKIDLIITKSLLRFSNNISDCIGYVRELKALNHPVGVFFEEENLYTLKDDFEIWLRDYIQVVGDI